MKKYRFVYWGVMLCALVYGLYSGNRFSWMLFFVQLFMLAAALGINLWTVWSFSYLQRLSAEQGEKGQTVDLQIGIYNDKPFPFTQMRIQVCAPVPEDDRMLEINLAPKDSCTFNLPISLPMRGEFLVGMARLELQDVFGLLPMRFDLRRLPYYRQKPILVLPRVWETTLSAGEKSAAAGGKNTPLPGQEGFASLRRWQAGDPLSLIHWKASARVGTLLTRQYEDAGGGSSLIFLDCAVLSDEPADRLTECAATLLYAHLSRGDQVSLACSSPQAAVLGKASSLEELTALRQWLALLRFDQQNTGEEQLSKMLYTGGFSQVYLLGGRFEPVLFSLLEDSGLSCRYWLAEPLELLPGEGGAVKAASFFGEELPEFLRREWMEEL